MRPLIAVACAVCSLRFSAQETPRYRTRVEAIRVDVLVTHRNQPIMGLTAADFEVSDNGVVQTIDRIETDQTPLDLLLVLDRSSSGRDGLGGAPGALSYSKDAARAALAALRPDDRAAVIFFSHYVSLRSPLTKKRDVLAKVIDEAQPYGSTALSDALVTAMLSSAPEPGRRTLLLVYTDGIDNISWVSPSDVIATASRTDAVVYVVTPRKDARFRAAERLGEYQSMNRFFADLTTSTGGSVMSSESRHLERTFANIVREFTRRYQLIYYPHGLTTGGWHSLTVRLTKRTGKVQARRGYYAQ